MSAANNDVRQRTWLFGTVGIGAFLALIVACDAADPSEPEGGRFVDGPVDGLVYYEYQPGAPGGSVSSTPRLTRNSGFFQRPGRSDAKVLFALGPVPLGYGTPGPTITLADLAWQLPGHPNWTPQPYGRDDSPALSDDRIINQARLLLTLGTIAPNTWGPFDENPIGEKLVIDPELSRRLLDLASGGFLPIDFNLPPDRFNNDPNLEIILRAAGKSPGDLVGPSEAREHLRETLERPETPIPILYPYSMGHERRCTHLRVRADRVQFRGAYVTLYWLYVGRDGNDPDLNGLAEVGRSADHTLGGQIELEVEVPPGTYRLQMTSARVDSFIESLGSEILTDTLPSDCGAMPDAGTAPVDGGGTTGPIDVTGTLWGSSRPSTIDPDSTFHEEWSFRSDGFCRVYTRQYDPAYTRGCDGTGVWNEAIGGGTSWSQSGADVTCVNSEFTRHFIRDGATLTHVENCRPGMPCVPIGTVYTLLTAPQTPVCSGDDFP